MTHAPGGHGGRRRRRSRPREGRGGPRVGRARRPVPRPPRRTCCAFCRERLAPYKVPARVEFRSELPKTMVGKVLRRALAAEDASACRTGGSGLPLAVMALHFDVRSSERLRIRAASSAAPGVSPCTQIVSTSRSRGAVDGKNGSGQGGFDDPSDNLIGIVDDRARLGPRHERPIGAIGAIRECLARRRADLLPQPAATKLAIAGSPKRMSDGSMHDRRARHRRRRRRDREQRY